jgi:hypothetical protein
MGWVECISFVSMMAHELDGLRARASIGWVGRMDEKIPWAGKVGNINTRYPVLMHTKSNRVIKQANKQKSVR